MKHDKKNNRIFFDNDDEFYNYVVDPAMIITQSDINGQYYNDFNLNPEYLDGVKNGCKYVIKDEDSKIFKHKAVSFRTITKPVYNLCPYYEGCDDIVFDCEC